MSEQRDNMKLWNFLNWQFFYYNIRVIQPTSTLAEAIGGGGAKVGIEHGK